MNIPTPGQPAPPDNITPRLQNLEAAMNQVVFVHIRDDDPAADPSTTVKPGDLWATLS